MSPIERLSATKLPEQDLAKLSFCKGSKAPDVEKWIDSLLATQIMQTSSLMYQALPEINRLKTDAKSRCEILETIRPSVQNCIIGLTKHFLHQPLILPKEAQKIAIVAQALQKNMVDGYTAVVIQILQGKKINKANQELLKLAIHRAITGVANLFLRSYQLYTTPPDELWGRIHALYQVAQEHQVSTQNVEDSLLVFTFAQNIQAAYTRVLMLATAKCNQLNQNDAFITFNAFEDWAQHVKLVAFNPESDNIYAFSPYHGAPPLYKGKAKMDDTEGALELDFSLVLRNMPNEYEQTNDIISTASALKTPIEFPTALFQHYRDCWISIAERKQDRKPIQGTAEICVGLVDTHFHLCNGQEFSYFVRNSGSGSPSAASLGFTPNEHAKPANTDASERHPMYRVALQNVSTGGYCMLWQGDVPAKVEAGELLGIKEIGSRTWSVGVVRWIKQLKQASQIGVQLLSNNPRPYGVLQSFDLGGNIDYSRAIYIPMSRFGSGSASILTPSIPFQEFDKIHVLDGDQEWSAKLEKNVFSSGNIKQFAYRPLTSDNEIEDTEEDYSNENYNSNW